MLSPPFTRVIVATWRTPTAVGWRSSSVFLRRSSFPIPMAMGERARARVVSAFSRDREADEISAVYRQVWAVWKG